MTALGLPSAQGAKATGQAALATVLRLLGWISINILVAFGVVLAVAFELGNFTIVGTMHHLANLSTRYVEASAARQHQFDVLLMGSMAGAFCLSGYFRRASLRRLLSKEFADV